MAEFPADGLADAPADDLADDDLYGDAPLDRALEVACAFGNLVEIQRLALDRNIFAKNYAGMSLVYLACKAGCPDILQWLFEVGANIREPCYGGVTPMMVALEYNDLEMAQWLAHNGAAEDLRTRDDHGESPLFKAAARGDIPTVEFLCLMGAQEDIVGAAMMNDTPMSAACLRGRLDMAKWLYANGADIRTINNHGDTPFFGNCRHGNLATAQWLVELGADIRTPNIAGETPMHAACRGCLPVAKWLFEIGAAADVQALDHLGCTPMFGACEEGKVDTAEWLLKVGADIRTPDRLGRTPMFGACYRGAMLAAVWLFENGAAEDIRTPNNHGETPMMAAFKYGELGVADWLFKVGAAADIFTPDDRGETPLRACVDREWMQDRAHWLVLHGAANGADGHADPVIVHRDIRTMFDLRPLLAATVAQHKAFLCMLSGTLPRAKRARRDSKRCALHLLQGHDVLMLVADFAGVVRGRALRNAREVLTIASPVEV